MASLVATRCPTCGAGLQIDPSVEFALCQYCSTSSFVRTQSRPVSRQVLQARSPVIDLARPRYGWLIAVAVLLTLGGSIAIAVALVQAVRRQKLPPVPTVQLSRQSGAPEPTVAASSTSSPIQDANAPAVAVPDSSSLARQSIVAAPQLGLSSEPTTKTAHGRVATGQITVSGRLEAATIRTVVGGNTARFRMCYEQGLARASTLSGRVVVRFVIGRDGTVSNVSNGGSELADASVTNCVIRAFYDLSFARPESGIVTVTYPLIFRPG